MGSFIQVKYFSREGTQPDLAAVARMSYGKDPFAVYEEEAAIWESKDEFDDEMAERLRDFNAKNLKTVETCFKCGHLSIFEFASLTFWIHCPIYVARQLMRYRAASYIERSLRRCDPLPPDDGQDEQINGIYADSLVRYNALRDDRKTKKELARAALTLATPTEFLMKTDLRELFHIFDERLTKAAQEDTRECVFKMYGVFQENFPDLADMYQRRRELQGDDFFREAFTTDNDNGN